MSVLPDTPGLGQRRFQPPDALLVAIVTVVALAIRLPLTLATPFPLGDGGLFFQIIEDVRRTIPAFPATTSYNGGDIPLVYPPLALYLTALVANAFNASTLDLLRFVPLTFSVLAVPLVYLLARRVLGSSAHAFVAGMAFAVLPRSYDWTIGAGGVTRAPGQVLALLTLIACLRAIERGGLRDWALVGIGLGATVVTHPQAGIFAAVATLVLVIFRGRGRWSLPGLATAAGCALALTAGWFSVLLAIHGPPGLAAVLSAGQRWQPLLGLESLLDFDVDAGAFYGSPVMLGFAGLVACLVRGRYLLPIWTALVFLAGAGGANFLAMPLVAMLIAAFLLDIAISVDEAVATRASRVRIVLVAAAILAIGVVNGASAIYGESLRLRGLSADQRSAMAWVGANTPATARFVVIEPAEWGIVGEWFPALAERESVNTLQGAEWQGMDAFLARGTVAVAMAYCAAREASCMLEAIEDADLSAVLLYVPKEIGSLGIDCCPALRQGLETSPGYRVIYDGPGATVFQPR